ncbi:hypothetical protein RJT34_07320 [Clitoria ternatea]|uniref:Uncharacterized protein n=1 Tax=Clitoria ternatea TaxID=43366 RepID=A0AAN9K380_CLITE
MLCSLIWKAEVFVFNYDERTGFGEEWKGKGPKYLPGWTGSIALPLTHVLPPSVPFTLLITALTLTILLFHFVTDVLSIRTSTFAFRVDSSVPQFGIDNYDSMLYFIFNLCPLVFLGAGQAEQAGQRGWALPSSEYSHPAGARVEVGSSRTQDEVYTLILAVGCWLLAVDLHYD